MTRTNHYSMATVVTEIWHQCFPLTNKCIAGNGVEGTFGLYGNGERTYTGRSKTSEAIQRRRSDMSRWIPNRFGDVAV